MIYPLQRARNHLRMVGKWKICQMSQHEINQHLFWEIAIYYHINYYDNIWRFAEKIYTKCIQNCLVCPIYVGKRKNSTHLWEIPLFKAIAKNRQILSVIMKMSVFMFQYQNWSRSTENFVGTREINIVVWRPLSHLLWQ